MDWKLVGGIGLVGLGLVGLRSQSKRAETFDAENAEKVLIDDILKKNRNNPYFPKQTIITWDTSFDNQWNNMPQDIIEGVDNMNPVIDGVKEDEIFLISLTPYEDVKGYGKGYYGAKIVWVDFKGRSQKQFYIDFMKANEGKKTIPYLNDSWRVFDGFGQEKHYMDAETAELLNAEIDMTIEDKDGTIYWQDKDRVQNYFKNWKKDSYPYEVRVMSETKQKWCENCGELDEDDEDSWEHYQSYLKRKNSTKPAFRFISGGGCHGCGMSLCQKCIEGDTTFNGFEPTCEECGYAFCGDCKDDMEDRCNPCQEEYEDSICDCCGYACGNKNAEDSWEAEGDSEDLLKWVEDYLWDNDKKGYQALSLIHI